jgi:propionate CoA-transferase
MDFAGMHVTSADQIDEIVAAIDAFLGPLGRKVNSVVNYERFGVADELLTRYADAVRYVEETYYLSVSRYTTSGFLRLKLGRELTSRALTGISEET